MTERASCLACIDYGEWKLTSCRRSVGIPITGHFQFHIRPWSWSLNEILIQPAVQDVQMDIIPSECPSLFLVSHISNFERRWGELRGYYVYYTTLGVNEVRLAGKFNRLRGPRGEKGEIQLERETKIELKYDKIQFSPDMANREKWQLRGKLARSCKRMRTHFSGGNSTVQEMSVRYIMVQLSFPLEMKNNQN